MPANECSDAELLACLLGLQGPPRPGDPAEPLREACRQVLDGLGGLSRVARMPWVELQRALPLGGLPGAPADSANRLAAALQLGRRGVAEPLPVGRAVHESSDLQPHLRGRFAGLRKEVFVVVLLDAKNRPMRVEEVSVGCLTWSVVHPREVFVPAVREGAAAVIVAHNHPSGDPEPSRQDLEVTDRLHRAGALLGIPLLDHLILAGERCVSLRGRRQLSGA